MSIEIVEGKHGLTEKKYKVAVAVIDALQPYILNGDHTPAQRNEFMPENLTLKELSRRTDFDPKEIYGAVNSTQRFSEEPKIDLPYCIRFEDAAARIWEITTQPGFPCNGFKRIQKAFGRNLSGRRNYFIKETIAAIDQESKDMQALNERVFLKQID